MPGPAATIGSMHVCPLVNGTVPHVGGPVSGPGEPTVLICGKPAAVMGDMCVCTGSPDTIVQGEATVLIGGKPAATIGCMTAHGGTITVGEPTVLIGTSVPVAKTTMPLQQIPFPKISILDDVGAFIIGKSKSQSEAKENIKEIKKEAEDTDKEPTIYNLKWRYEDKIINQKKVLTEVILSAFVTNANDGETVSFEAVRKNRDGSEQIINVSGQVDKGQITASIKIDEIDDNK